MMDSFDQTLTEEQRLMRQCCRSFVDQVVTPFLREDEFLHEPCGAAMHMRLKASLGNDGRITHWLHDVWSHRHSRRPGHESGVGLLAARQINPSLPTRGGIRFAG